MLGISVPPWKPPWGLFEGDSFSEGPPGGAGSVVASQSIRSRIHAVEVVNAVKTNNNNEEDKKSTPYW